MKSINLKVIIVERWDSHSLKEDPKKKFLGFLAADQTGSILINLINDVGEHVKLGDILIILGGFVMFHGGRIRFACRVGKVQCVDNFCMLFRRSPYMSSATWALKPGVTDMRQMEATFPAEDSPEFKKFLESKDDGKKKVVPQKRTHVTK